MATALRKKETLALRPGDLDFSDDVDTYVEAERREVPSTSTPWWVWLIVGIIFLALIGVVIWLAVTRNNDECNTTTTPARDAAADIVATNSVLNVNIEGISSTSIRATWTWTASAAADDQAVLYVFPAGDNVQFDENGVPLTPVPNSGTVRNPGISALVSQLTPNANYNAKLVITNPNRVGVIGTYDQTGITLTAPITLGPKFQIVASGQCGEISYRDTDDDGFPDQIFYTLGGTNPNDSLFHRDTDGFICATTQSETVIAETPCDDGSSILYDTGNAGTTSLSIIRKSDFADLGLSEENARWEYNTAENKWCNRSGTRCILYNVGAAPTVTLNDPDNPTTSTATITQPIFVSATGSR